MQGDGGFHLPPAGRFLFFWMLWATAPDTSGRPAAERARPCHIVGFRAVADELGLARRCV